MEKETVMPNTKPKKGIGRITESELIECYKYYFQDLPPRLLQFQIIGLKKYSEREVYNKRKSKKKEPSKNELVFADNIEGRTYPYLMKKYSLSRRGVAKAIYESRKKLIDGIKRDIEKGKLNYNPTFKE